jgi:hypothetical protein
MMSTVKEVKDIETVSDSKGKKHVIIHKVPDIQPALPSPDGKTDRELLLLIGRRVGAFK